MVPPTSGRIVFDGHDITKLPPHRRAQLGISRTFQITNLFPTLSVQDNMVPGPARAVAAQILAVRRRPTPMPSKRRGSPRRSSAARIARPRRCHRARKCPMASSASSRLRMALVTHADACCCSTSRPPACRHRSAQWSPRSSGRCDRDITMVLIEHDMDLALGLVDYVTCMFEGRILVEEAPEGIRRNKTGAGSLSREAASCLRFAICTAAMATRSWCTACRSTSAPARSSRCSAATAWARPPSSARSWG